MKDSKDKYIYYDGDEIGYIHRYYSHGKDKFNIHLDWFGALEKLCRLDKNKILEIEGMSKMKYKNFKEEILSKAEAIYFSMKLHLDFNPLKGTW